MALAPIDLPDASLGLDPAWLAADEADMLFAALHAGVQWEVHRIRMFGRTVDSPRLSCWIADPEATYRYSGTRFEPRPWLPALHAVRERLAAELEQALVAAGRGQFAEEKASGSAGGSAQGGGAESRPAGLCLAGESWENVGVDLLSYSCLSQDTLFISTMWV